jgi:hypothetical protein
MKLKPKQMKAWTHKCAGVVTSLNSRAKDQKQIPYPPKLEIAKAKVIVPKPKAK